MFRFMMFVAAVVAVSPAAHADPAMNAEELEFLRLINEYRAANGLGCLAPSPTLNDAADYMSRTMGEQDFTAHNEPPCDESGEVCTGRTADQRIRDFGNDATAFGENIAAGVETAAKAFEGWKNSPGHNANMLREQFTAIGIARVEVPGSRWGTYWTTPFSDLVDGPWDCDGPPPAGDQASGAEKDRAGGGGCGAERGGAPSWALLTLAAIALPLRRRAVTKASR